jgi:hypothetical protein
MPSKYGFDYYGGAVYANQGSQLRVEDCVIVDNAWETGTFAGGVYSGGEGTHVTVVGCVIANNRAWASGGATLSDYSGAITLERCTVYGNSSDDFYGRQGGISIANAGTVEVRDCVVWGNEGSEIGAFGAPYDVDTESIVSFSCVEDGHEGTANTSSDPEFANLEDFHLLPGSPCIQAGDPLSGSGGLGLDQGARWLGWTGVPAPVPYCSAKVNSLGCVPTLVVQGEPSLGGADDFHVVATNLRNQQFGALFWSTTPDQAPYGGAYRCVGAPMFRTVHQLAGGSPWPAQDCTGSLDVFLDHAALVSMGGAGAQFYAQIWSRDPGHLDGTNVGLTSALCVTIAP